MSDLLTERDLKTERATEPPKRWRNWYRALRLFVTPSAMVARGAAYPSPRTWPSKEIAEQKAADSARDPERPSGDGAAVWLGAFPDGEAP